MAVGSQVRGQKVVDTGGPIMVPVGAATLGRIMNVIGEPVDERGPIKVLLARPPAGHRCDALTRSWRFTGREEVPHPPRRPGVHRPEH